MYQLTEEIVRKAIKYLKRDIYDDWYCDLQNYDDLFHDVKKITNTLNSKIAEGNGVYKADKSILFNIPKGNCAFRYTLELKPIDRLAFHVFGLKLIGIIDHTLPYNILSHRKSLEDDTLFKPMIEQWNKFENFTKICGKDKYILEADISNYYDNIDVKKLKNELVIAASESGIDSASFIKSMYLIESIASILRSISFNGYRGLPQNRDICSFLANIYMRPIDKCLKDSTYFRYMDDIRVIADSRAEANRLMLKIIETLRICGLSLNGSKTKLLEPNTEEHDIFCNDQDLESKKIDAMINSGKRKYVLDSFQDIYNKVIFFLDAKKINDRKYRFYSNRLITFLNAKDIKVPTKYKKELAEKLIGGIDSRPDCADQICAIAQAVGPHTGLQKNLSEWATNEDNLTFEWAVYSVIKTLTMQNFKSKNLVCYCKKRLSDEKSPESIRGISAVFLNNKAKSLIMRSISKNNSHFLTDLIQVINIDDKRINAITKVKECRIDYSNLIKHYTHSNDQKIYPFYQTVASSSGRIFISSPGTQYLKKSKRDIFLASEGFKLAYFDFRNYEPGIAAGLSNDRKFIDFYNSNDMYLKIATEFYGSRDQRKNVKITVLASLYGMSESSLKDYFKTNSGFDPKKTLELFETFDVFNLWRKKITDECLRDKKIIHDSYTRLFIPEREWKIKTSALNHIIQSTGSKILKRCISKIIGNDSVNILIPMHDALLCELKEKQFNELREQIIATMEDIFLEEVVNVRSKVVVSAFSV